MSTVYSAYSFDMTIKKSSTWSCHNSAKIIDDLYLLMPFMFLVNTIEMSVERELWRDTRLVHWDPVYGSGTMFHGNSSQTDISSFCCRGGTNHFTWAVSDTSPCILLCAHWDSIGQTVSIESSWTKSCICFLHHAIRQRTSACRKDG